LRVAAFLRDELRERTCRARHLPALAGTQLDVVNLRTERDINQRKRVTRQNVSLSAAHDRLADFQTCRREDVTFLAVQVSDQRDVRGTIRIVFDLRDASGYAVLVALEVDNPV